MNTFINAKSEEFNIYLSLLQYTIIIILVSKVVYKATNRVYYNAYISIERSTYRHQRERERDKDARSIPWPCPAGVSVANTCGKGRKAQKALLEEVVSRLTCRRRPCQCWELLGVAGE